MKRIGWLLLAFFILLVAIPLGYFGYLKYRVYLEPNVPGSLDSELFKVSTNSTFDEVLKGLAENGFVRDTSGIREVAARLKYIREPMRSGQYRIRPGWNNLELVRHLRGGAQAPVRLVLNHARLLSDVAGKVASFIEADSTALVQLFQNPAYVDSIGFSQQTLMSLFIPNTYEFYWDTGPREFMERMLREHDKFWSANDRSGRAESLGLTPVQVYTLASIVEKETNQASEKARIAGVYLNRLEIGMLLQADPTLVFATRDFEARRVLDYHKQFDSPYNTYLYPGLPPGPISMASISSIDAVLSPEEHKYLYFCAKPDGSGQHVFARTLQQHNINANRYRRSLRN